MKELKLTPEWVLSNLSGTLSSNLHKKGTGLIIIYGFQDALNSQLTELAFETLGVNYETEEYYSDDSKTDLDTYYIFELEDIKDECPNLYKTLKDMND